MTFSPFCPSGEDIDKAIKLAEETMQQNNSTNKRQLAFLPLYGSLPQQMQARIFQAKTDGNVRRIIFATNIAETSVTVPDITYVIDCGYAKIPYFDPKTGFERLIVSPISRASALQRAGRSGRVRPGKCYRLYTEKFMTEKMEAATPPEIMRTNLTSFILTLKALGVHNILAFDLMNLPSVDALSTRSRESVCSRRFRRPNKPNGFGNEDGIFSNGAACVSYVTGSVGYRMFVGSFGGSERTAGQGSLCAASISTAAIGLRFSHDRNC